VVAIVAIGLLLWWRRCTPAQPPLPLTKLLNGKAPDSGDPPHVPSSNITTGSGATGGSELQISAASHAAAASTASADSMLGAIPTARSTHPSGYSSQQPFKPSNRTVVSLGNQLCVHYNVAIKRCTAACMLAVLMPQSKKWIVVLRWVALMRHLKA
jgi:hypothetical protein